MDEDNNFFNVSGTILIFSFLSIIIIFISMVIIASINNYGLFYILSLAETLFSAGFIDSVLYDTLVFIIDDYGRILNYLDILWFGSFIILVSSSFIYSYHSKQESLFTLFNFAVLGVMIFTYVGSIISEITQWFNINILIAVFPDIINIMPKFTWYLNNVLWVNIIIISICVILNFTNLNLSKFKIRKKDEDSIDEI